MSANRRRLHGLDASILPAIAAAVLEAWTNGTDPGQVPALGVTMREAGLVVAANVLDQRALVLDGWPPIARRAVGAARPRGRRDVLRVDSWDARRAARP